MLIESDFAPLVDATFFVMLDLGAETFSTNARAAFVQAVAGNRERSEIGVEFVDLTDADRAKLKQLIESDFCTRDVETDSDAEGDG